VAQNGVNQWEMKVALAHNPRIITDGLVLCLDAANTKSYSGSGTEWKDLSGNGNDGTLVNGVGFSGDNKGSMIFDGVDDFVDLNNQSGELDLNNSEFLTFDFFVYPNENQGYILWCATGSQGTRSSQQYTILFDSSNRLSVSGGSSGAQTTEPLSVDTWYHVVMIIERNESLSLYLNSEQLLVFNPGSVRSGDSVRVGARIGGVYYQGKVSSFKVYNRAFSAEEIRQNFQAMRGRYGI